MAVPATATQSVPRPGQHRLVVACAVVALIGIVGLQQPGSRLPALWVVGIALGVTLYHAAFGFTGAYRKLFLGRGSVGVQAQLGMVALSTLLFAPLFALSGDLGLDLYGAWAPVGMQVAIGAFLFGVGMQLGGGCGSGTLFGTGGGDARTAVTLLFFCVGAFWASLHMSYWQSLPGIDAVVLGQELGWGAAALLQAGLLLGLLLLLRRRDGTVEAVSDATRSAWRRLLAGPWSPWTGALALTLLAVVTLLLAGHPWTITWAFSLWGAKAAMLLGWDPSGSAFWSAPFQSAALAAGVLEDTTSVMNLGIVLGALTASALAGRFAPNLRIGAGPLAAAVLGGLLLGYGARIAFGCNIGAFFSGIASTSLHGWLWIACALLGNLFGVRLRPRFGIVD
jgi:uncharacterized membrane protein YedE/YeeE